MTATRPYTIPAFNRPATAGQIGTGVVVVSILRMRDDLNRRQIRRKHQSRTVEERAKSNLEQLEVILANPPTKESPLTLINFGRSLQELSFRPEDMVNPLGDPADRDCFLRICSVIPIANCKPSARSGRTGADYWGKRINSLAQRIAALNDEIGKVTAVGAPTISWTSGNSSSRELAGLTNISVQTDHMSGYTHYHFRVVTGLGGPRQFPGLCQEAGTRKV